MNLIEIKKMVLNSARDIWDSDILRKAHGNRH